MSENLRHHNTELLLLPSILQITKSVITSRGIEVLGLDIENVLCGAGAESPAIWAAKALQGLEASLNGEAQLVVITNATDPDFVENIASQLHLPYVAKDPANGIPSKTHQQIYEHTAERFGTSTDKMGMIDDQLKTFKGARAAGIKTYFWTRAFGRINHKGVLATSIAEKLILRSGVKLVQAMRHYPNKS